jgi:hypothetical protein
MTIRKARRQERAKAPDSKLHAPPKMTMYIFASPVTLTGAEEKKTGPSRFRPDFLTELSKLSKFRINKRAYTRFTQPIYRKYTLRLHRKYTQ